MRHRRPPLPPPAPSAARVALPVDAPFGNCRCLLHNSLHTAGCWARDSMHLINLDGSPISLTGVSYYSASPVQFGPARPLHQHGDQLPRRGRPATLPGGRPPERPPPPAAPQLRRHRAHSPCTARSVDCSSLKARVQHCNAARMCTLDVPGAGTASGVVNIRRTLTPCIMIPFCLQNREHLKFNFCLDAGWG